jgi:hypothetical protein
VDPVTLVVVVAIASSIDFALVIGTPPTMIAYSTKLFTAREIFRTGIVDRHRRRRPAGHGRHMDVAGRRGGVERKAEEGGGRQRKAEEGVKKEGGGGQRKAEAGGQRLEAGATNLERGKRATNLTPPAKLEKIARPAPARFGSSLLAPRP